MDKSEWEGPSGDSWAAQWKRTDRSFAVLTDRLLSRLRGQSFGQVLDVGCGAGELSLAIARGRPDARVIGVDVSSALVATARERARNLPNVAFDLADAAEWQAEMKLHDELFVRRWDPRWEALLADRRLPLPTASPQTPRRPSSRNPRGSRGPPRRSRRS